MRRMAIVILAAGLAVPAVARAAGGPVAPVEGGSGVGVPGGSVRYLTVNVPGWTVLERVKGQTVDSWQNLRGLFGVPAAAFDGSTTGLSADGRTLVLAGFPRRYPPRRTRLLVLRLKRSGAHVQARLSIPGYFTVDAISPDGRRLYLIHYTHPSDVLRYEVRAYDLRRRRLLAKPIVDPREPDEKMQGQPQARVTSADGRWAYTLYSRAQGAPFIHALDTKAGTAACIDLDGLTNPADGVLRLLPPRGNGPLVVAYSGGPVKLVDRRTFKVSNPSAPATPRTPAARHSAASPDHGGGGLPWAAGAALLAAIALLGLTARAARARSAA